MNEATETHQPTGNVVLAKPPEPLSFFYLIGFLIFPFGILLGFAYLRKDGIANKAFGTRMLAAGFALPVIMALIAGVSLLLI